MRIKFDLDLSRTLVFSPLRPLICAGGPGCSSIGGGFLSELGAAVIGEYEKPEMKGD